MNKEEMKVMEQIFHWMVIQAKIKLSEAKRQVALHEEFIKNMEQKKEELIDNGKERKNSI